MTKPQQNLNNSMKDFKDFFNNIKRINDTLFNSNQLIEQTNIPKNDNINTNNNKDIEVNNTNKPTIYDDIFG